MQYVAVKLPCNTRIARCLHLWWFCSFQTLRASPSKEPRFWSPLRENGHELALRLGIDFPYAQAGLPTYVMRMWPTRQDAASRSMKPKGISWTIIPDAALPGRLPRRDVKRLWPDMIWIQHNQVLISSEVVDWKTNAKESQCLEGQRIAQICLQKTSKNKVAEDNLKGVVL